MWGGGNVPSGPGALAWDQGGMGSRRPSSPSGTRCVCRHLVATCPHCSCGVPRSTRNESGRLGLSLMLGHRREQGPGTVWLTESSHMFTWWAHHPSFMRSRSGTERSSHPLACTRLMRPNPGHLWGRRHHMLPLGAASRRSPQTNVSYELKRQQNHREPWVSRGKAGFEPHLGAQLAVILHLSLPGNPATSPALHGCREGSRSCPRKCCAHREVPHKSGGGIICTNFTR